MELTILLAQVFGIYMLVMGIAMLLGREKFMRSMEELASQRGNMLFLGAVIFLLGLGFALRHNLWGTPTEIVVSIMLWGATVKGLSAILFPEFLRSATKVFSKPSLYMIGSILVIAIGGYLTFQGFWA